MLENQSNSIKSCGRGGRREGAGRKVGVPNKVGIELRQAASAYTADALETLASIARDGLSESARVAAACALLDRAHGRPKQHVDMENTAPLIVYLDADDRAA
jgi:hypothetical protein